MDSRLRGEFERLGVDHVRWLVISGRIEAGRVDYAVEWLADQDREERLRSEASNSSHIRTALSAKYAAWIAAIAAIVTVIVEIIESVI